MAAKIKFHLSNNPNDVIVIDETEIKLPLGRPIDPESERQKRLRTYEEKREAGLLHRGRPADPSSPSHKAKVDREAKKEAGIELKRGRPVIPGSTRQEMLAKRSARLAIIKAQFEAGELKNTELGDRISSAIAASKMNQQN